MYILHVYKQFVFQKMGTCVNNQKQKAPEKNALCREV